MFFNIRPMEAADHAEVCKIYNFMLDELHGDNTAARESYSKQYTTERMQTLSSDPAAILYTSEINNVIAGFGFGRVTGGVGFINWMGIRPGMRGGKAGQQLLGRFLKEFKNQNCHKVELYTYQNHPKLETFYKRAGFIETAKLNNHYYNLDIVYMTKNI